MSAAKNDVTGDKIQSKVPSKAYLDNYDKIFSKTKEKYANALADLSKGDGDEAGVSDEEGTFRYDLPETD